MSGTPFPHEAHCGVHFGSVGCTCGAILDPPDAQGYAPSPERAALELAFRWIAKLPEGRTPREATCAYVPADVYDQIKAAIYAEPASGSGGESR